MAPYPPDAPLSDRKLRTQKHYCDAVCRALEENPPADANPFRDVMQSYVPKTLIFRTDKWEAALLKLTGQLGAPFTPPALFAPIVLECESFAFTYMQWFPASIFLPLTLLFYPFPPASQYLSTTDRTIRKAALANLTQTSMSRTKINLILDDLAKSVTINTVFECIGKHRWRAGKSLYQHLDNTGNFPASTYSSRLTPELGMEMCQFIQDHCALGWKPNHIHEYDCGGYRHKNPRLLRDIKPHAFWNLFQKQRENDDAAAALAAANATAVNPLDDDLAPLQKHSWRPGRGTFLLLLEHITKEIKNKTCLSYYYTRMVQSFDDHDKFLVHLLDLYDGGMKEWEKIHDDSTATTCPMKPRLPPRHEIVSKRREVKEVFGFAKHHMAGHLVVGSHQTCRHHCVNHALGGCSEEHNGECHPCGKLHRFGENMSRFHQAWCNTLCVAFEKVCPSFKKSARTANATEYTIPVYVQRKVKKDFGPDHGVCYGAVKESFHDEITGTLLHTVTYGDGDSEDLETTELLPLLLPETAADDFDRPEDPDAPAGDSRTMLYDLVRLARHNAHIPQAWCSHQARGKHQQHHIDLQEAEPLLPGCGDIVSLDIDLMSKKLPSKRLTAQGEGMGLRGMSLHGGMYSALRRGTADGKPYIDRQYIHSIYAHGSKQTHDDATRGIQAQLEFIAATATSRRRVRIRSDKCNNFCTFAQIAFIIEGNARGWRPLKDGQSWHPPMAPPMVQVISWTFSEAQCGKDQLDVNFSYVSKSYATYVSGGLNLLTPADMLKAIKKHPIKGTSALLVDVRSAEVMPVYDKCSLGLSRCHHFEYGPLEVVVRHHNNIENVGVWRTPNSAVMKWIEGGGAVRRPNKDHRPYVPKIPTVIDEVKNLAPTRKKGAAKGNLGKRTHKV